MLGLARTRFSLPVESVVVVGMARNPFVKRVRKELTDAGIAFTGHTEFFEERAQARMGMSPG